MTGQKCRAWQWRTDYWEHSVANLLWVSSVAAMAISWAVEAANDVTRTCIEQPSMNSATNMVIETSWHTPVFSTQQLCAIWSVIVTPCNVKPPVICIVRFLSRLSFAVEPLGVLFLFVSACRCINIVEHKVTWKCRFVACCPVAELLPVRLSGNMLVSINIATRRQVRLVPEWVTDWLSQDG